MKAPRWTLRGVMAAVAMAAANLALVRAAVAGEPDVLLTAGPPVVGLQVAAWRAVTGRGADRAYWLGYLLLGGFATGTLIWGMAHPALHARLPSGGIATIRPASPLHRAWQGYFLLLRDLAWPYRSLVGWLPASGFLLSLLMVYGPQVGAGVLGGGIGRRLSNGRGGSAPARLQGGETR
jgi:hypothetical protein